MSGRTLRPVFLARRHRIVLTIAACLMLLLLVLVAILSYRTALLASEDLAKSRLTAQVKGLSSSLEKYRLLTSLVARRPGVLSVLSSAQDDEDIDAALEDMGRIGGMSGAAEIELTFLDGETLAMLSGQWRRSEVQKRRQLMRPDIQQALEGRLGRLFMIIDGYRFYVFSRAARIDGRPVGVVSVHVDLSLTEQVWALSQQPIVATENGTVVLANRTGWYGSHVIGAADKKKEKTGPVRLLRRNKWFGAELMTIEPVLLVSQEDDYVVASNTDPLLGWTFYAFEPLRQPVFMAVLAVVIVALLAGLLLGGLWVVFNRQRQQLAQRRKDMASSFWLERRVKNRTRELRQTQEGLIHSAKLAAIGQMSAVLSHEYNQPLAAIRTYADNAQLLFDKGRAEQGNDNLARIGKLVDRLANLSKTLKTFARRPGVDTKAVSVETAVDESVLLMQPKARKSHVDLVVIKDETDFFVLAGHTRLEQVLINLIANALDAIAEAKADRKEAHLAGCSRIQIRLSRRDGMGIITVSDDGPGISDIIREEIFEPFVTSKERGVGLGLGLPIALNLVNGFGGSLVLIEPENSTLKTCFEVSLPLARE